jgi:hypothetical protein
VLRAHASIRDPPEVRQHRPRGRRRRPEIARRKLMMKEEVHLSR